MKTLNMAVCADRHGFPVNLDPMPLKKMAQIRQFYISRFVQHRERGLVGHSAEQNSFKPVCNRTYTSVDCRSQCLQRRKNWRYAVPL